VGKKWPWVEIDQPIISNKLKVRIILRQAEGSSTVLLCSLCPKDLISTPKKNHGLANRVKGQNKRGKKKKREKR